MSGERKEDTALWLLTAHRSPLTLPQPPRHALHQYGIVCEYSSKPTITGNLFDSNATSIYLDRVSPPSIENNTFLNTTNEIQLSGTASLLSDRTIPNDLHIVGVSSGVLDLNGKRLSIAGDLSLNNCGLRVNGGALFLAGNLEITGSGSLRMVDPLDLVEVEGNALFGGGSSFNLLTSGLLKVAGNFTQAGEPYSLHATGDHQVILDGSGLQIVTFEDPSSSHFQNIEITNTSLTGCCF